VKLTLEVNETTERFGLEVETGLFRILQEALTNVHRHSGAVAVHIRITSTDGRLTLSIQDDGKGIPSDALVNGRQGVGLSSMRERSALLSGTFSVKSNSRGTLIVVSVPLQTPKSLVSAFLLSIALVSETAFHEISPDHLKDWLRSRRKFECVQALIRFEAGWRTGSAF
jgi:signal transduction histidine kinase